MTTPKYDPPDDEPRLVAYTSWNGDCWIDAVDEHGVHRPMGNQLQRIALAIADRVHGAELASLREQCEKNSTALSHVYALRYALVAELQYYRDQEGHPEHGFTAEVMQAFNKASTFLGLPVTDGRGVPMELHPTEPEEPFQPTMHVADDGCYVVTWGRQATDRQRYAFLPGALEDFGERYAAWKAATR